MEVHMARVAVVTGGTRGIGRAISIALRIAGYNVAANYGGDDNAAQQFNEESGIPVFKFDVADFNACAEGVKKIETQLGPIEVLVNNAGITRDATMHRMNYEQWNAVIQHLGARIGRLAPRSWRDRKASPFLTSESQRAI
jgi:acetoacetyl-CoA reductase